MDKQTFAQWKQRVDDRIAAKCGIGADDLPDWDYIGAYERGMAPSAAAAAAIRSAKDF